MMFNVEFWGGPRDGDTVYQLPRPCDDYWIETGNTTAALEVLRTPVLNSVLTSEESHHYQLEWRGELNCKYVYKGVVNK